MAGWLVVDHFPFLSNIHPIIYIHPYPTHTGYVYTWGESSYGQLGLGPDVVARNSSPLPRRVLLLNDTDAANAPLVAAQISCGGMHTGAVTADGRLYMWGRGDNGQLGVGRLGREDLASMGGVYGGCVGLSAPALVDPACFESPVKQVGKGSGKGWGLAVWCDN